MRHAHKRFITFWLVAIPVCISLLCGCGKDYCSYGGCMREAESGGKCSAQQGMENDSDYGKPD